MPSGPKIQAPSNLGQMFETGPNGEIIGTKPQYASFLHSLQQTAFAVTRSGPTTSRPTSNMDGRWIGMPFFDTDISQTVFLQSVNPDVWVTWAAPAGGGVTSVAVSSNAPPITVSGSPITGLGGTITLNASFGTAATTASSTYALVSSYVYQAQIGTAASTAASTYAIAASSYVYTAQLGTAASTAASTYVYATSVGTAASTAASTWALAASSYVYTAQIGTAGSTASSTYAFASTMGTAATTASSTYAFAANIGTAGSTASSTYAFASVFTTINTTMSSTVAIGSANTYTTGVSVSITPAGTWLIDGTILLGANVLTTGAYVYGRLFDGTNTLASGVSDINNFASSYASIALSAILVNTAATTVSLQGAATYSTSMFVRPALFNVASGTTATMINAVRIK